MPTSWLDLLHRGSTLSSLLLCPESTASLRVVSPTACQLLCPVSTAPVRGSTPTLPAPFSNQLSFVSPYHFRIRRDFRFKNPLSGFAPKQTMESSAWRATYIVLHESCDPGLYLRHMFYCHLITCNTDALCIVAIIRGIGINVPGWCCLR